MTATHPERSSSPDGTAVSDAGHDTSVMDEIAPGQRFPPQNQSEKERDRTWRPSLRPDSPWKVLRATVIANLGEPYGESRLRPDIAAFAGAIASDPAVGHSDFAKS